MHNLIFKNLKKYFVFLLIWSIAGIGYNALFHIRLFDFFKNPAESTFNNSSLVLGIFTLLIVTPILEELSFRLPIRNNNKLLFISFIISSLVLPYKIGVFDFSNSGKFYFSIIISHWIIILISKLFLDKNFERIVLYSSSIIFGLLHLLNFQGITLSNFPLFVFFILPQIYAGYLMANLRLTKGFIYGLYLHFAINLLALAFFFVGQWGKLINF